MRRKAEVESATVEVSEGFRDDADMLGQSSLSIVSINCLLRNEGTYNPKADLPSAQITRSHTPSTLSMTGLSKDASPSAVPRRSVVLQRWRG